MSPRSRLSEEARDIERAIHEAGRTLDPHAALEACVRAYRYATKRQPLDAVGSSANSPSNCECGPDIAEKESPAESFTGTLVPMRAPCWSCGSMRGLVYRKRSQWVVRCASCGEYCYSAPKTEAARWGVK